MSNTQRRRTARSLPTILAVLLGLTLALLATPASSSPAESATAESASAAAALPSSYQWSSSGPLLLPQSSIGSVAAKDPSVVRDADGTWHVFFTKVTTSGDWGLAYTSFDDWSQAGSARQYDLEAVSGVGGGYRAAPHVFYYEPRDEWYMVYQTGLPSYSVTKDINNPSSWSTPRNFQSSVPSIVQQNIGNGYWLDFWVICDASMCYLFSADDNGHLYRAETTVGEFPNGFRNTQIVLQDSKNLLFEGDAIYRVEGSNTYLLLMEAIGSDGKRWYRSFTAEGLTGQWRPLAATESNPFARSNNVSFPSGTWSRDISHGELVRTGADQYMDIDPCDLQLVYQGMDPNAGGEYSQLPWRIGLATHSNSPC